MSQALYRKWRPSRWDEVVGQEHVLQTLRNQVASDRTRHAYIFAGPRGTGKTTTARLLAKALNCRAVDPAGRPCDECGTCRAINAGAYLDLIEIDAASNNSVEDVRDLRDKIGLVPNNPNGYKVYIIDEVHMLSNSAFNALLKTLEEPPPHAVFILATTDQEKIPATILSRSQLHMFRRIPVTEIMAVLKKIAAEESLDVEEGALRTIARQSAGGLRDAISLLDQLSSSGQTVTIERTMDVLGTSPSQVASQVVEALLHRDTAAGLKALAQAVDGGAEPRQIARQVVEYLRGLMLVQMGSGDQLDVTRDALQEMDIQARQLSSAQLVEILGFFNEVGYAERSSTWHPSLLLEMAFARSVDLDTPAAHSRAATQAGAPAAASPPPPRAPVPARVESAATKPADTPAEKQPVAQSVQGPSAPRPESTQPAPAGPVPQPVQQAAPTDSQPGDDESGRRDFHTIQQNWAKIRALIKRQSPQAEALLNSGKLLGVKGSALLISLSPNLRGMLAQPDKLEIVNRAIHAVTGLGIQIQVMEKTTRPAKLPADIEVEDDGVVGTALRDLGGEVIDIQ